MEWRTRIVGIALAAALIVSSGVIVLGHTWFSAEQHNRGTPAAVGHRVTNPTYSASYCIVKSTNTC